MKPISKKFWGADSNDNIKVQFNNGTASVRGYIVKQTGSRKFICKDENGVEAICWLVDKPSASLSANEMSITVKFDDGTVKQIIKIAQHLVYFSTGVAMPWNFSTSTGDGYVQIEEAGTNAAMDDATDLEGDDVNIGRDYPAPFSGDYKTGYDGLSFVNSYSDAGTPFEPGGSKTNAQTAGYGGGLRREKYDGNFCGANNTNPSAWNYSWFGSSPTFLGEIFDPAVSFGNQTDGPVTPGGSHFSIEWKGWVQVPASQNYNWYVTTDDHAAIWIGTAATNAPAFGTYMLAGNNSTMACSNSVTMDNSKWYPVRIWFSEFTGGCNMQVFLHGANGAKYNGDNLMWRYNPQGEGW